MKSTLIHIALLLIGSSWVTTIVYGQRYNLDNCIQTALSSNISLKEAKNNLLISQLSNKQAWYNILPELNASWNINKIYGTAFDNVSFQRIQKATTTSFPSLDASISLFNGFRLYYSQKNTFEQVKSFESELKNQEIEILLRVTENFYAYIQNRKKEELARNRIKAIEQLEKLSRLKKEGGENSTTDYYTVLAQLESEKAFLLEAVSASESSKVDLLSKMGLTYNESIEFTENLEPFEGKKNYSIDSVYKLAVENNFKLNSAKHMWMSEKYGRNQLYSNFLPRVVLGGSLASNYSSNGIFDFNTGTVTYPTYLEQMRLNNYQIIGLTVQIPLFNKWSNYSSLKQSTLRVELKKIAVEQEKLELFNKTTNYCNTYSLLLQKKQALETALMAAQQAYKQIEIQYKAGESDFYAFLNALNKLNQCELDLVQNQFELVLKAKLIRGLMGQ